MISTSTWAGLLMDAGFTLAAGVPCSSLSPLQNHFLTAKRIHYIAAPNEGQAVAVASGAVMAGQRAVVLMQNSGLGNAINPLTSLVEVFGLPLLLVVSWRGQPGHPDEPQHDRMGQATHGILDAVNIPHVTLAADDTEARRQLRWSIDLAERERRCVAIVAPDGVFEPTRAPAHRPDLHSPGTYEDLTQPGQELSRADTLVLLRALTSPGAIRLATTGKTSRELFTLCDEPVNLYVVGSMGLASSIGLGMSLVQHRKVVVIDGDGAALMHLGALPMIARYAGENLVHVVLDNGCYDSTGGQRSIASHAPFAEIAARCGYAHAARVNEPMGLTRAMGAAATGPALLHVLTQPGSPPNLPRPTLTPHETLTRLQTHLRIRQ